MSEPTEKKSKKRQHNLDAMLDEAELSLSSSVKDQEDEDAIDRLLIDAGFENDEELEQTPDENVFSAEFDEFGDDFDLADISTDSELSDTEINPNDDLKVDQDFPLELLDTLDITTDEEITAIENPMNEDEDIISLDGDDDKNKTLISDESETSLTEALDEFSDFQDFQEPEIAENNDIEEDSPKDMVALELNESIEKDIDPQPETIAADDLIIDIDNDIDISETKDEAEIEPETELDEFGDDFDEYYNKISGSNSNGNSEESQDDMDFEDTIPSSDFDITADLEDELFDETEDADEFSEVSETLVAEPKVVEAEDEASAKVDNPENTLPEKPAPSPSVLEDASALAALMQFKSEQETLNSKYKKQISEFEASNKKPPKLTYFALSFGIISFIAAVTLGALLYGTKSKISTLTEQVNVLEKGLATKPAIDSKAHIENVPSEKANHLAAAEPTEEHLPKHEAPLAKEADHESSAIEAEHNADKADADAEEKSHMKPLQEEQHAVKKPVSHEDSESEKTTDKIETKPTESDEGHSEAITNKESALPEKTESADSKTKIEPPADSEKKESVKEIIAPAEKVKSEIPAKKKAIKSNTKKNPVIKKANTITTGSDWSVNLIAYKQQWFASSKSAEFAQKGIPIEIIPVKIDNVTWYRLRVSGFSDKEEADAYAHRVKKALNLSSVWVGKK